MQRRKGLRGTTIRIIDSIGLGKIARRAKANGWFGWIPLVPEDTFLVSCFDAIRRLRNSRHDFGDYLEFGVCRGTSLACMHHALARENLAQVRLFGFDSFEGLPPEAAQEGWKPGEFKSSLKATQRYLNRAGIDWNRVTLTKGWFKHTLTPQTRDRLKIEKASMIMIDCDIYSASRDALRFSEPLIRDRTVVFLDDWKVAGNAGQQKAFEEFLTDFPHFRAEPLSSYSEYARVLFADTHGTYVLADLSHWQ